MRASSHQLFFAVHVEISPFFFSFSLCWIKGGKLGILFCTANLVDRIDFARFAAKVLAPLPLLCCHKACAVPQGELAVPVCIVLLRRRYPIGTLVLITFGSPDYLILCGYWVDFWCGGGTAGDKTGAVPIHLRTSTVSFLCFALRVVLACHPSPAVAWNSLHLRVCKSRGNNFCIAAYP